MLCGKYLIDFFFTSHCMDSVCKITFLSDLLLVVVESYILLKRKKLI